MAKVDLQKLRTDAEKYRGKGKLDKAIEIYEEIEKNKGADAKTLQKMAEIYLKLDDEDKGIDAYRKAMKSYRETGFLVQAIAVGKILQELCEDDEEINEEVEAMLAKKASGPGKIPSKRAAAEDLAKEHAQAEAKEEEEEPAEEEPKEEEEEEEEEKTASEPEAKQAIAPEPAEEPAEEEAEPTAEAEEATSIDFLLFKHLSPEELAVVYQKLRSVKIPRGVKICREGDTGDSIFIIAQGEAEVTKKNQKGEERLLATLKPGQFFGEFGYFAGGSRSATVEAVTDLELLEISKQDMDEVVSKYPQIKEVMAEFYKQRVLDNLLVLSPLTAVFSAEDRKKLIDRFELKELAAEQVIVNEGDPGDAMFLIKSGKAEVTTIDPKDKRKLMLARLGPGEFFGEVSLIKNKPRTATVTALSDVELLTISKQSFDQLTKDHPEMVSLLEQTIEKRVEDTIKKIIGGKK
jgi:CRP-like cAMP-binding protein